MSNRDTLMDLYRAFNERDIDAALEHMAPGVDWPNAMSGGREHGRDAVRAYWTKQWREIDPRVEPLSIDAGTDGRIHVRVDQLVKSLEGGIIDHRHLEHVYTFDGPFIARMDILPVAGEEDDEDDE